MDPFEPLKYQKPLEALKARIAKEGSKAVFAPLMDQYILRNPHRVTVEMQVIIVNSNFVSLKRYVLLVSVKYDCSFLQPDPEKASREEQIEKETLDKVKASMTQEDLAELARATHELLLKQETPDPPEALKSVPSLSLQDIPREPVLVPTEVITTYPVLFFSLIRLN